MKGTHSEMISSLSTCQPVYLPACLSSSSSICPSQSIESDQHHSHLTLQFNWFLKFPILGASDIESRLQGLPSSSRPTVNWLDNLISHLLQLKLSFSPEIYYSDVDNLDQCYTKYGLRTSSISLGAC